MDCCQNPRVDGEAKKAGERLRSFLTEMASKAQANSARD